MIKIKGVSVMVDFYIMEVHSNTVSPISASFSKHLPVTDIQVQLQVLLVAGGLHRYYGVLSNDGVDPMRNHTDSKTPSNTHSKVGPKNHY